MKINWRVRAKNPTFWVQVATVIMTPLLAAAGISWSQITSWPELGQILWDGLSSPVLVAAIVAGLWGVINDPTTRGLGDSADTMAAGCPRANVTQTATNSAATIKTTTTAAKETTKTTETTETKEVAETTGSKKTGS